MLFQSPVYHFEEAIGQGQPPGVHPPLVFQLMKGQILQTKKFSLTLTTPQEGTLQQRLYEEKNIEEKDRIQSQGRYTPPYPDLSIFMWHAKRKRTSTLHLMASKDLRVPYLNVDGKETNGSGTSGIYCGPNGSRESPDPGIGESSRLSSGCLR